MPAPPLFGIVGLLEKLGVLQNDPETFDEASRNAGHVLVAPGQDDAHTRIAQAIGILPQTGEQLGSFWNRQLPGGLLPPSLRQSQGQDINLPKDVPMRRKHPAAYDKAMLDSINQKLAGRE